MIFSSPNRENGRDTRIRCLDLLDLLDGVDDGLRADAVLLDEHHGGSGAGHLAHAELAEDDVPAVGDGVGDGAADSALGVVVLDGDDAAAALQGVLDDGLLVEGLDGEGVEDAGGGAGGGELIRGSEGLVQGHASGDDESLKGNK